MVDDWGMLWMVGAETNQHVALDSEFGGLPVAAHKQTDDLLCV